MQTQEMYWKQKYDNLFENYNIFMNEYKNKQSTAKTTTGKCIVLLFFIVSKISII